jgi:hypothetical protein
VKVVFAVADVTKLKYVPFEPEQEGKPTGDTEPMTFALSGPTLTITNPEADKKKSGAPEKPKRSVDEMAMMKSQMAMMKPMLAGMRLTVEVKGANGIASSDATHLDDGEIIYLDVQFDKLMNNTDAFGSFMEAADEDINMADAAAKFGKVEGLKIEGKRVVKAELK